MTNEMAKRSSYEITSYEGAWGAGESVDAEDLLLGRILMQQGLSPAVSRGEAQVGEIRGSLDNKLYAERGKDIELVIFDQTKVWMEFIKKPDEDKVRWNRTFAFCADNHSLPWEERLESGIVVTRQKALDFFCLVVDENYQENMPVVLRAKSTSYKMGRGLVTLFSNWASRKPPLPSAHKTILVRTEMDKNEKGAFCVWAFKEGRQATEEEKRYAYQWFKTLQVAKREGRMAVDEEEERGGGSDETVTSAESMPPVDSYESAATQVDDDADFV